MVFKLIHLLILHYILFCLFQLGGCGLLGVGVWLSVSQGSFATLSPSFPSISAANLIITLGAVIMVTGFLGCLGAIKENKCLLLSVSELHDPRCTTLHCLAHWQPHLPLSSLMFPVVFHHVVGDSVGGADPTHPVLRIHRQCKTPIEATCQFNPWLSFHLWFLFP